MSALIKSATIQLRVTPVVKAASEQVLWGIGMSMSEAVELFLRRVIVDARIPFEIVALDPVQLEETLSKSAETDADPSVGVRALPKAMRKGDPAAEKIEKPFRQGRTPSRIGAQERGKKERN
jgi:addiction module RelB/DinJ family antitoxin